MLAVNLLAGTTNRLGQLHAWLCWACNVPLCGLTLSIMGRHGVLCAMEFCVARMEFQSKEKVETFPKQSKHLKKV